MAGKSTNRWGTTRAIAPAQHEPRPPQPPAANHARPAAPAPGIVHRKRPVTHETPGAGYSRPHGRRFEHELARATEGAPSPPASAPVYAQPAQELAPRSERPRRTREKQPRTRGSAPANPLMQPKILVPALVVVLVLGVAMGFTPGGGGRGNSLAESYPVSPIATLTAGDLALSALPSATQLATATFAGQEPSPVPANLTVSALATQNAGRTAVPNENEHGATIAHPDAADSSTTPAAGSTNQVAGVQASATPEPTIDYTPTQCGTIQETATQVNVEQVINGVSVKATQAAVYPIEYLRCILMATGSRDSMAIAGSLDKAEREGATHGVLIDLWVTNSQKDFAQVNLKSAIVAAVGQTFSPIATLNGRADLVISGGQGRSVGLVVALTQALETSVGPMTVQIDGPMLGGKLIPGKFQLFLPTP